MFKACDCQQRTKITNDRQKRAKKQPLPGFRRQRLKGLESADCAKIALKTRFSELRLFGQIFLGKDEVASSNLAISSTSSQARCFNGPGGFSFARFDELNHEPFSIKPNYTHIENAL